METAFDRFQAFAISGASAFKELQSCARHYWARSLFKRVGAKLLFFFFEAATPRISQPTRPRRFWSWTYQPGRELLLGFSSELKALKGWVGGGSPFQASEKLGCRWDFPHGTRVLGQRVAFLAGAPCARRGAAGMQVNSPGPCQPRS